MSRKTVLLVDPDDRDRKSTEAVVVALGYDVVSHATVEAAADELNAKVPSLVLTAHPLPMESGDNFAHYVAEQQPDLCVVGMIRRGMREVARDVLTHGCKGFLSKPVEPDLLGKKLRELIGGASDEPWPLVDH
jgi:two-component system, NtrC family, C4-dicarboxylate transport response regulator DctD